MEPAAILKQAAVEGWTDEEVVARVLSGEAAVYEIVMRRYNQRLYRVIRSIVRDDHETEDVIQDTYVRAYRHLHQFARRARFSTWLTRIAVHESLARLRRRAGTDQLETQVEGESAMLLKDNSSSPEENAARVEASRLLENAILNLPEAYRTVVVMRDIEEMSTAETAESLSISEENVKTRLHRGHALIRRTLIATVGKQAASAFPFMAGRCDRIVQRVFEALQQGLPASEKPIHI
jgi:RNA polymerase sigma-70 factor (ECF subfamily)